ncbi:hypothetical protein HanRHA438_Chr08g0353971 [Helianthus annuus]|nr:hypothetical protein HanHA300_Chr08g0283011 [Helianthus annuus]KAJ0553795.1 hypothetical protein HanHA89_Chr08g0300411 [Helianthus annuus]KAJ0719455.1 hypothetical protein HanLR1_Chr08g0281951 [Helianthus annuus]KAJ0722682.1 hypothetical protein HanOQP8_Chr08g0289431 [Helianthus annuus]KAJ0898182.1 hypothetical protein HanRHA438_Chr08g0353971 [Helianthus annuus]
MELKVSDVNQWKVALSAYDSRIQSLNKPDLASLDHFYTKQLPSIIHKRNPNPYITTPELSNLMKWKLTRGKWRFLTYLLNFIHCIVLCALILCLNLLIDCMSKN